MTRPMLVRLSFVHFMIAANLIYDIQANPPYLCCLNKAFHGSEGTCTLWCSLEIRQFRVFKGRRFTILSPKV